ncbi:hypothetical protein [Mucilaginibacter sp.]|uniref:hypothetical protein n=1 Tax=Mucilaginibacter sp. TaxID=1882438 RepID=UPI00284027F6|nr:hypothetical protein [Mucilaginibacter sp.]MDR3694140.1 hypothetical protein [Mucilaginibacter sp.]
MTLHPIFKNALLFIIAGINIAYAQTTNQAVKQTSFSSPQKPADTIVHLDTPLSGFYAKYINCDGIIIRSANIVADSALVIASSKVWLMLNQMPNTRKNLVKNGSELHIIGKDQQTSDLPEFRDKKGVSYTENGVLTDIDKRTRGMGGVCASCGEENLLRLPTDRYRGGSDICIHEFAHTIMDHGFDAAIRKKIETQYHRALNKRLWKDAYASSNPQEYWAELSMWYFGFHGEFLKGTNLPAAGVQGLRDYDADGYKLLDSLYTGIIQPAVEKQKESILVSKGAKSGVSTERADLSVINNTSGKVKLFWVDWSGGEKLYATINANSSIIQPTFISHVWLIEKENGESFYIRVNNSPCEIKLTQ